MIGIVIIILAILKTSGWIMWLFILTGIADLVSQLELAIYKETR